MRKLIFFLILVFNQSSFAIENSHFLILKHNKVNVRYGPGLDYDVKYIYKKKYLPVKVIDKKENFRKIVDLKKNSGWIHSSQLKKGKSFILLKEEILYSKPTKYSNPLVKISKGKLLQSKKCQKKWCKIKTDNYSGWIETNYIWGSIN